MSSLLARVARFAFRRAWLVISVWLVLLGAVIVPVAINGIAITSDTSISGTESQDVLDRVADLSDATGGQASIVFTVPDGERVDTGARVAAILGAVDAVYGVEHVVDARPALAAQAQEQQRQIAEAVAALPAEMQAAALQQAQTEMAVRLQAQVEQLGYGPLMVDGAPLPSVLVAATGDIALFQFQFDGQLTSLPAGTTEAVVDAAMNADGVEQLTVLPTNSLNDVLAGLSVGAGEVIGVSVAAIVLVLALGSLVAAGLPLLTALVGVGFGVVGSLAFSALVPMNSITPVLGLMIGLAVGIDYALFIVNRQRRLILDEGLSAADATVRAAGTAGSAVFFAGLTVVIALTALTTINIGLLNLMAIVAAVTVTSAVLVALTLLPALLGLIGERIVSAKARAAHERKGSGRHPIATAWSGFVTRMRWPVVVGVVAILGVVAIPAVGMSLGMPDGGTANTDTTARRSFDAISEGFGAGFNGPLLLVAETEDATALDEAQVAQLTVGLAEVDGIEVVQQIGASPDGDVVILTAIPSTGPSDEATADLVNRLRDPALPAAVGNGVVLGVTGQAAVNIDMADKLADVLPIYVVIIVGLSILILLLVFRSVLVPVIATAGFVLSLLATLGVTTLVFQDGWAKELFGFDTVSPVMPFIPIFATGILYGLAMDYQVFLGTAMREAFRNGETPVGAIRRGFAISSRVVVAAGLIMGSVFSGFIFTDEVMIKQIGFALAAGILIDAFLIRMTLVPALMAILGRSVWWLPTWLDRVLPDLDIEGHRLAALPAPEPVMSLS